MSITKLAMVVIQEVRPETAVFRDFGAGLHGYGRFSCEAGRS